MNTIDVSFPIREVTVYPSGARMTRAGTVVFNKGESRLIITSLPEEITEDSVRIETGEKLNVKITDIFSEDIIKEGYDENLYRKEKAKLDAIILEQKKCEALFKNYTDEFLIFLGKERFIDSLKEDFKRSLVVNNWEEFYTFMRKKLTTNREETRKVIFAWLGLQEKREAAEQNVKKLLSYERIKEHRVIACLESMNEGEEEVRIMYLQPGVSWYPAYTVRADMKKNLLSITLFGMIRQTTGEDWENIAILLSTAIPMQQCAIPEVKSKRIKERDTAIVPAKAATGKACASEKEVMDDALLAAAYDKSEMADEIDMDMEKKDTEIKPKLGKKIMKQAAKKSKEIIGKKGGPAYMEQTDITSESADNGISSLMEGGVKTRRAAAAKVSDEEAGKRGIGDLVAGVDKKILPGFSLDSLSSYYSDLYSYITDTFSPEHIVPVSRDVKINKFFTKGVSLLNSIGGFDYRYRVGSTKNVIPSSQVPVQIGVDTRELPIEMVYVTVPLEKEAVYLKAVFTNKYENPFPAGPAQVFVENNFLGTIVFPTLGMNEGTSISLGIERDIKVIRKETSERKTGGIVKKGIAVTFTIEIELVSYKTEPVTCEVLDRVPLSDNKQDITIMIEKYGPKPHRVTDRNIVVWRVRLEPKKKKVITFSYTIRHPENYRLTMRQADHPYLGV
jgi:hypothetical protein